MGHHRDESDETGGLKRAKISPEVTRRGFLGGTATAGATALAGIAGSAQEALAQEMDAAGGETVDVSLVINGVSYERSLDARTTILDLLREELDLTGTKVGCNHGQCGACTVLMNGTRINSCLTLAAMADGARITTIEGLAEGNGDLHPMQAAFLEHDGFQCGYCTPGQIVSAIGCVKEGHADSEAEIREYMSGNLCRCGAYKGITEAIIEARDATRSSDVGGAS
ncbi:(2Fe-2S)-binding protein [Jiella avicenniae]|uniref:(2Fe-2S)-binding protein n=1 Tax=Jiella avicenniae TaxID=2907202 RepID=A0A9X1P357_9HYPH|nr:(2Fe-2S)-binding protein [Jiella avicenniae]MCE7029648.1 (2Fe-2S)-binding protein [Jiella avicenniae]